MSEGDKQIKKYLKGKANTNNAVQRYGINVSSFFQSVWIRCRSVFPNITDRKFMESELRFVLYSGILFWFLHLLYEIIKQTK